MTTTPGIQSGIARRRQRYACATIMAGIIGLSWLAFPRLVTAQSHLVNTYHVNDGLPSDEVYSSAQDAVGRMWFATRGGLVIYDGLRWQVIDRPESLLGASSQHLAADGRGFMWLTTSDPRNLIMAFKSDSWSDMSKIGSISWAGPSPASLHLDVTALAVLSDDDTTTVALGVRGLGLLIWNRGAWITLDADSGLPTGSIRSIAAHGGIFYVATDSGLCTVEDGVVDTTIAATLPAITGRIEALSIAASADGPTDEEQIPELWLLDQGHLYRSRSGNFELMSSGFRLISSGPRAAVLRSTPEGCVIFGQLHRLYHFDVASSALEPIGQMTGLTTNGAYDIDRDREGNLWFASHQGVSKICSFRFESFFTRHGLLENEVTAVAERADGEIVLGHNNGLSLLKGGVIRRLPFPETTLLNSTPPRVMDLVVDDADRIWIAASHAGIGMLDTQDQLHWFPMPQELARDAVYALVELGDGSLLVGGSRGLYNFDGRTIRRLPFADHTISGVRRLARLHDGTIVAATASAGLIEVRATETWIYPATDEAKTQLYTVFEDSQNRVWVGARAGLFRLLDGRVVGTGAADPKISAPVYMVVEDQEGDLWFGSEDGVVRWRATDTRIYSLNDGLAGRETNRAGGLLDSRGRVWIGTESGVSVYRPEHDWLSDRAPSVDLISIEAEDQGTLGDGEQALAHDVNSLTFHFAGVSFNDETTLQYRYRLVGFDSEWSAEIPAHQRSVRYTSLPPGRYHFEIQAKTRTTSWSAVTTSNQIEIQKPYWLSWWFAPMVIALLLALVAGFTRTVTHWRAAAVLEERVRVRTAELEAVNLALQEEMEGRRQAEESYRQAQRMESVGRLAGGVAHDFNNLLAVILGFAEISLELVPSDHPVRPNIEEILDTSERAAALTQQLLAVARRQVIEPQVLDLNEVILGLNRMLRRLVGEHIELVTLPGANLNPVKVDLAQLEQMVLNLVINARDAMPEGGTLTVETSNLTLHSGSTERYRNASPGNFVELTIRDTGQGIGDDVKSHIFEPFFTTKERENGTGLGLATCFGIVSQSGGHIGLESRVGEGTIFGILLPAALEDTAQTKNTLPPPATTGGDETVLVVEDETRLRDLVTMILRRKGYNVLEAANGVDALKVVEETPDSIDLVVTDLVMPQMGGRLLAEHLRSAQPHLRIVFMSGYAGDDHLDVTTMAEGAEFLHKPFSPTLLTTTVRNLLDASG